MTDEHLDTLWHRLMSAASVKDLDYAEAVTIGSVFGEMRNEIKRLQEALEFCAYTNKDIACESLEK